MPQWPVETWIGLATLLAAVAGAVFAAYWQSRKPPDEAAEAPYRPRVHLIRLDDDDRQLIRRSTERIEEAFGDHRRAIEDQTATLKRGQDD